jgi:hypothetical protein
MFTLQIFGSAHYPAVIDQLPPPSHRLIVAAPGLPLTASGGDSDRIDPITVRHNLGESLPFD